jgi:DNA-binding GntR family transcriptional regulator
LSAPVASAPSEQKGVVEELVDALEEAIISGSVRSGTWLRQERIAAEYGVSRTPVREALRALQAQGIVEVVPNRGALVTGPSVRDLREAYAVRAELEGYAAELAATWVRDEQLEQLREAAEMFREAVAQAAQGSDRDGSPLSAPRWSQANDLFHEAVLEAAGNARLAETIHFLHRGFPRNLTWSALADNSHLRQQNVKEHDEILRAIEAHDPQAAREAMHRHVSRSGDLVIRRFESFQSATGAE